MNVADINKKFVWVEAIKLLIMGMKNGEICWKKNSRYDSGENR